MLSSRATARGLDSALQNRQNPANFLGLGWAGVWAGMMGWRGLVVGLCGLALAGCATAPASPEALANNDPYEQTNRETMKLNAKIDKYFVIPTVGLYFLVVPEGGRRSVHNFLGNLSLP